MSDTHGSSQDWGDKTEWQDPQGSQQPPPYGYQQGPAYPPPPQYQTPQPPWQGAASPAIQNYMVPAVLVTLFCCLPTGIAAIVFASQVSSKRNAGDYNGAVLASKRAKMWTIISVAVGVVLIAIIVIASAASQNTGTTG